ncbi:hypothetical protein A7R75_27040 [Mycolicibacterium llatzerense]|nr:hypothetical protein [Mycolicibacterium llatzerense]
MAWWIADIATWISISFSAFAYSCAEFAQRRSGTTALDEAFITHLGQYFGYVGIGWIVISVVLALLCRFRHGIARETTTYLLLLLLAIVASVVAT